MQPDPEFAAMNHPQFQELLDRTFTPIGQTRWPVEQIANFYEWRWIGDEFVPPFALWMRWFGEDRLSPEQEAWFSDRRAFGHVGLMPLVHNGEQFQQLCLTVFDMAPQSKPVAMFHATRTERLASILASGLMPGRLTGVSTTNFPEAHRWIHFFPKVEDTTDQFLFQRENKKRIKPGRYTILRVASNGIDGLYCDPFSAHGFVTHSDVIHPQHITELHEVTVED
jgi:hypothetical protein